MKKIYCFFLVALAIGCKSQQTGESSAVNRFTGSSVGCGNFQVFVMDNSGTAYLQIGMEASTALLEGSNSYPVEESPVQVVVREFDGDVSNQPCNDIMSNNPPKPLTVRKATSGEVSILLDVENKVKFEKGEPYRVTIRLDKVVFEGDENPFSLTLKDVVVGWLPG